MVPHGVKRQRSAIDGGKRSEKVPRAALTRRDHIWQVKGTIWELEVGDEKIKLDTKEVSGAEKVGVSR